MKKKIIFWIVITVLLLCYWYFFMFKKFQGLDTPAAPTMEQIIDIQQESPVGNREAEQEIG